MRRTLLFAGSLVAAAVIAAPASASSARAAAQANAVFEPVRACESLGSLDLSAVSAQVESAAVTTMNDVSFCEVKGYISPQTHFTVLLPRQSWRGEYLQQGCGALCGFSDVNLSDPSRVGAHQAPWQPLAAGEVVVAAGDQGHQASPFDGLWAKEDPMLRVVFGYRSEHDLARAAKAVIGAYYGRAPAYSYFDGLSTGGRQGLALAQRYPRDFDGILVGTPAHNWAALAGMLQPWLVRANMDAHGRQILDASKLPALHAAVMNACADAHGVIVDPRACTFDPASIQCPADTDRPDCLTPAQVTVVERLYRGPTWRAQHLYDGGAPYGSEPSWLGWLIGPANDPAWPNNTIAATVGLAYHRYMAYWRNPPASFSLGDVEFTARAYRRLQPLGRIYDATNPDLRAFRAHGGKLILYHGWADQVIPPQSTLNYYRAVIRHMGGYTATQRFSRLYMIPGLYHCACGPYGTGDPATMPELMDELADWVKNGNAPDQVTFPVTGQTTGTPLSSLTVRPFDPLEPAPRNDGLNSNYRYIGERSTYRPGRELWCEQHGQRLVCRRAALPEGTRAAHRNRARKEG
jgi:Tannase and feruloyl esterase